MRALLCMVMTWLLAGAALAAESRHLAVTLVAETARPAAGSSVTLAFDSRPEPEWHGYWINGGDAGVPTTAKWTLPAGVTAGELQYPVPGRLLVSGLMNYVYEKPYAHLVELRVPAGLASGTRLPISVKLDYLVCTREICVPESQTLSTELTVGDGAVEPGTRAPFDAWRQAMPKPLGSQARFAVADGKFRMAVPFPADAALGEAYFFPLAGGAIDFAAPQTVTRSGDALIVETKAAPIGTPPTTLEGVLTVGERGGFLVSASPGAAAAGETAGSEVGWRAALLAFGGAVLGGLLLNIMPCVFPILSLKALSLARSGADTSAARREALAYTGGAVLACLGLGAVILALRAGGSAVGWAFQLQDPRVIVVLLALTVAIALNLSGLFEVPTPRFAGREGSGGAFATGALAAFVATPCTGPFMGAALGAALVLPVAAALAVFAGLGLGLALPFLLIGFVPALRRRLPKPGAWMATFRRVLAVPMWLTALALAWVLGRQAGVNAMTWGLGASLVVGFALWLAGRRQARGLGAGLPLAAALVLAVGLAVAVPRSAPAAEVAGGDEAFSETRLAALRAEKRPVFAYFTADWCLTCKVNEAGAIDRAAVRDAFGAQKVAVLVGDWTDGDAELGRFIAKHNRAGVPLYLWYEPGASEPTVLPQVLTPSLLTDLAEKRG
ncbi:protein-disulfide reductase DsbD family protein [Sphingomonas sp.]|uniref:protein-disulfide reductase DsbD family protein n=1 Tax=Sphingomonas sp. TaxID=28214 RepID=UPI002D7EA119|nr:protein-disulfide reductase DsbD domain-containing protein [Sphingomonas sp.]HEU0044266.1 protein-disulfide reductase DsbD domain-containing protein [Sphingomonas sp.]